MIVDTIQSQFGSFTDNRGVSPVIGVILMVAITVILAAIVGSFVLGIGVSGENPQAGVTADTVVDDNGDIDEVVLQLNSNNNVANFELTDNGDDAEIGTVDVISDGNNENLFNGNEVGSQAVIDLEQEEQFDNPDADQLTLTVVGDTGEDKGVVTSFNFDAEEIAEFEA